MTEIIFPEKSEILALQSELIEKFGGIHGLRDSGAFESALMAAENRYYYEDAQLSVLAALMLTTYRRHTHFLMVTNALQRQLPEFFLE